MPTSGNGPEYGAFPLSYWEAYLVGVEADDWSPLAALIAEDTGRVAEDVEIQLVLGWDWKAGVGN